MEEEEKKGRKQEVKQYMYPSLLCFTCPWVASVVVEATMSGEMVPPIWRPECWGGGRGKAYQEIQRKYMCMYMYTSRIHEQSST